MPAIAKSALRWGALGALLVAFAAPSAMAAPPTYRGSSADGETIVFESEEQLVPGDTDFKRDLYVRAFDATVGEGGAYVTREVSVGPTGGNDAYNALFERVSADGSRVFFSTEESLTATDTDRKSDVYVRNLVLGTAELVSMGAASCTPLCGNAELDAGFAGATPDGSKVFLVTVERLDPTADTDEAVDVYVRDLGAKTTKLVSGGGAGCEPSCGNGAFNATLRGLSTDGSRAFFATAEPLTGSDEDEAIDVYARDLPSGPTALVSAGDPACSPCGNSDASAAVFAGSSADGSRAFFASDEGLVSGDTDGANDVYMRFEGATTLLSGGSATQPASFASATADGTRVFFVTAESLVGGADENSANDVYMWEGSSPQLISSGSCCGSTFGAATEGGEAVLFTTTEQLDAADTDASADIYEQLVAGGSPTLISAGGNAAAAARFNRAASDGSRVFFTTDEALSLQDFDTDDDIYARDVGAETTTLATPPPGLCPTSSCDATFVDASADATHAIFQTVERLAAEDVDTEADIYERAPDAELEADVTRLVSTGNDAGLELGPAPPNLTGTSPASPSSSTEPRLLGEAQAEALIKVYPTSSCSGEPVATGTAEELAEPGIAVSVSAGSTTSFWATAEAEGFTSLCSNPISYKQESPAPPPGESPESESPTNGGDSSGGSKSPKTYGDGIAYVKPVVKITFGPAFKTRARRPAFRFRDQTGQPGTRFKCRIDRQRWSSCRSPQRLKKLGGGRHVFRVKAINALGQRSKRPARRVFKVVSR